jgi:hypothetical protein
VEIHQFIAILVIGSVALGVAVMSLGIRLSTSHVVKGRFVLYGLLAFGIWGMMKLCSLAFVLATSNPW